MLYVIEIHVQCILYRLCRYECLFLLFSHSSCSAKMLRAADEGTSTPMFAQHSSFQIGPRFYNHVHNVRVCTFMYNLLHHSASPCDKLPYLSCRHSVCAQDLSSCPDTSEPVHEIPQQCLLSCSHRERCSVEDVQPCSPEAHKTSFSQVNLCLVL